VSCIAYLVPGVLPSRRLIIVVGVSTSVRHRWNMSIAFRSALQDISRHLREEGGQEEEEEEEEEEEVVEEWVARHREGSEIW